LRKVDFKLNKKKNRGKNDNRKDEELWDGRGGSNLFMQQGEKVKKTTERPERK